MGLRTDPSEPSLLAWPLALGDPKRENQRLADLVHPEQEGPEQEGPEQEGPEQEGPEKEGPEKEGE